MPSNTPPNKLAVSVAAICVGVAWFLLFVFALLFVLVTGAVILGLLPSHIPMTRSMTYVILTIFGFFAPCGYTYIIIALRIRCPRCGYKFLKNPKGLGPTGFTYHPSCPRKFGLNPWAIQIGRFLSIHKIRCINCGEELFD